MPESNTPVIPSKVSSQSDRIAERENYILGHPTRLPALAESDRTPEQQKLYEQMSVLVVDGVLKPRQDLDSLQVLIRHADLYSAHLNLGKQFLSGCEMPLRDRELAILRIGWLSQAPFEWGAHVNIAKANGISAAEIEQVMEGAAADGWSDHDRALLRAMEELHVDSMISDETWEVLARRYNDKQLIEVTVLAGQYKTVAYMQNALRLPLTPSNQGLKAR